jgi:hypothetical protein
MENCCLLNVDSILQKSPRTIDPKHTSRVTLVNRP